MWKVWTRIREAYDWAERAHFWPVLWKAIKEVYGWIVGGGLLMTIAAVFAEWSWFAIFCAGLLGAVAVAIVAILLRVWHLAPKGGTQIDTVESTSADNKPNLVDPESVRLAGTVNALLERALKWNFKLPLPGDDLWLKRHDEVKDSAHPIWTDKVASDLRKDFLHQCGIIGHRTELDYSFKEIQAERIELIDFGNRLIARLTGNAIDGSWRPVHIALAHIAKKISDDGECWPEARPVLRQAAYDKRVKIRGRKQLADVLPQTVFAKIHTDIENDYWAVSEINALATDGNSQELHHALPQTAYAWGKRGLDEPNQQAQLLVKWADITREWPA